MKNDTPSFSTTYLAEVERIEVGFLARGPGASKVVGKLDVDHFQS